jgi:hypothetical protein
MHFIDAVTVEMIFQQILRCFWSGCGGIAHHSSSFWPNPVVVAINQRLGLQSPLCCVGLIFLIIFIPTSGAMDLRLMRIRDDEAPHKERNFKLTSAGRGSQPSEVCLTVVWECFVLKNCCQIHMSGRIFGTCIVFGVVVIIVVVIMPLLPLYLGCLS